MKLEQWLERQLAHYTIQHRLRTLVPVQQRPEEGTLTVAGTAYINCASNRYLGSLSVVEAQSAPCGGAGASRVAVGTDELVSAFERRWATLIGKPSALLFGSGYAANVGVVQALADRDVVVLSDRLNHASITDGIVLSRAKHVRYAHRDVDDLRTKLEQVGHRTRTLIVTDAVFSMDGTVAPLEDIVHVAHQYGAAVIVDEAHSGGVLGPEGRGLVAALGLTDAVDVIIGTFSKAYDSYGAYVAGTEALCTYLIQAARSFVYSTALPPAVIAMTAQHIDCAQQQGWRRERLLRHARLLRTQWSDCGMRVVGDIEPKSGIVPVIVGEAERTMAIAQFLREQGVYALAVRPPTVPEQTCRLRFSCMATHTDEQIETVIEQMRQAAQRWRIV